MKIQVETNWKKNMAFEAVVNGHKLTMDIDTASGGEDAGPRPKPLLLAALAGCTGMDIVSLLNKMRVPFEDLKIFTEGELSEEHPKMVTKIHVTYQIKGKDLDMNKVNKAIQMSEEKYCGVEATLKSNVEITSSVEVVE